MAGNGKQRAPLVAERRYPPAGSGGGSEPPRRAPPRKPKRRKPAPAKRRRGILGWVAGFFRWFFGMVFGLAFRLGLLLAIMIGAGSLYFASTMPPIDQIVDGRARGSVTMLDRTGEVYAWRGEQFGGMITSDTVSVHLRNAIIATEDKRFYHHLGVSPRGIASAIAINLREGRGPLSGNGGSTITQQTAKLLCLGVPYNPNTWPTERAYEDDCRQTTLWRKIKEAVYSVGMELAYSKDEILTIYLNRAYLGSGTRGFEAAAQRYFGKSAANVTPAEAAMLAGLLKAPTTYAPTSNLERAQTRANLVVGLMEEQGYLSATAADEARANPAVLSVAAQRRAGGYFADWVMEDGPEYFTRDTTEDVIISTTLDQNIQNAAESALLNVFDTRIKEGSEVQAAIVVMSADGAVRAMVGGRNLTASGAFNRATQALRQTGSSFKPFVYATALDLGMSPYDIVDDSPLTMNIVGSGPWTPANYDNEFKGPITLIQALQESRNIPAVRVSEMVGRDNVRAVAQGFGLSSDLADGPALALGVSESTLLTMTAAYAGILNGGSAVKPYGLVDLRLQGEAEPMMSQTGGIGERVIRQDAAQQLIWMMSQVVQGGTGARAQIPGWEIAGKTGTTQGARDAWFIGFTADYVCGVWMGYDNNTPMTGVTGGGLPAQIWHETMVRVLQGMTPTPLPMIAPVQPFAPAPDLMPGAPGNFFGIPVNPSNNGTGNNGQGRGNGNGNGNGNRNNSGGAIVDILRAIIGGN